MAPQQPLSSIHTVPSGPPAMSSTSFLTRPSPTITRVETILVDVPLKQRTITDSQSSVASVEFVQVKVETDAGVIGWGFNWNYTKGLKAVQVMIDEAYAPAIVGRPALDRHALMQAMNATTHFIGRVGVARVGLCAVNLALWDIQLKLEQQPLWRHLGPCKDRVRAYNTDGGWLSWSIDELVADMQRIIDRGFDSVKMKLGRPDPREDFERVRAVRRAIGDRVNLMVDVNTVWDLKTAVTWGRRLEEFDISWLEEPMHPFDVAAHAELARELDVPIAVGETIYTLHDFRDYIDRRAVDIVQADVTKLSGIEEWLDVAALARAHGLTVIPHTNVQQNVHVQLAAATPNAPLVECCYESIHDIWEDPVRVEGGWYTLPEAPGVGGKLTDTVLAEYRIG
ncbi:MAG: mandelate racemase/muconate lactonizing enzyme family protein [Planctomycetota bacterium]|nr:MAG: mandelate racemase/muconate lactonizing enzyme family protein [Planctomycetota bacterium]